MDKFEDNNFNNSNFRHALSGGASPIALQSYDEVLKLIIPNINNFPRLKGGEGSAYFIDDDLVVKVYSKADTSKKKDTNNVGLFFKNYCNEIKDFASRGYSMPKIYSWSEDKNNLYVLQERIKGRTLYIPNLRAFYPNVKAEFSRVEYDRVLLNGRNKVFLKIYRMFANDFISINKILESLPESEIEAFVKEVYSMYIYGQFSSPDIYGRNIISSNLNNGFNVTIIDQNPQIGMNEQLKMLVACEFMAFTLYNMFRMNTILISTLNYYKSINYEYGLYFSELEDLINANLKVSKAGFKKFFKVAKKVLELPKFSNYFIKEDIKNNIAQIFGDDKKFANEVINIMDK